MATFLYRVPPQDHSISFPLLQVEAPSASADLSSCSSSSDEEDREDVEESGSNSLTSSPASSSPHPSSTPLRYPAHPWMPSSIEEEDEEILTSPEMETSKSAGTVGKLKLTIDRSLLPPVVQLQGGFVMADRGQVLNRSIL